MKIDELKKQIDAYRQTLKERANYPVVSTEDGPIGMGVIDAIVSTLEDQEKRLKAIEREVSRLTSDDPADHER